MHYQIFNAPIYKNHLHEIVSTALRGDYNSIRKNKKNSHSFWSLNILKVANLKATFSDGQIRVIKHADYGTK